MSNAPALLPYTYENPDMVRRYRAGRGVYLYTTDGRRILDGLSGSMNANLGHGNAVVAAAMQEQALGLTSMPSIAGDVSEECLAMAERLREILGIPGYTCIFNSSGSEATETAIAVAWKYWSEVGRPHKTRFFSLDRSYHGCTLGALALTGRADEHADVAHQLGRVRMPLPSWHPKDPSRVSDALLTALESVGPEKIAAIFLEPVMGLAGMIPAARDDIRRVVHICRANDILVVLDEALTGLGRAGSMTAAGLFDIDFDLLLVSKGLGCGFAPVAATCMASHVASALLTAVPTLRHGHTSSGNPLAARVALTVLDQLETRDAVANAARMGSLLRKGLTAAAADVDGEIALRVTGLCIAVEIAREDLAQEVRRQAFELGLRIRAIDRNVIVCPPLIIDPGETAQLADLLHRALIRAHRRR